MSGRIVAGAVVACLAWYTLAIIGLVPLHP